MAAVVVGNDTLRVLCDYWQKALRLQDWVVIVRLARASEFANSIHCGGQVEWSILKRAAVIKISEAEDYANLCNKDFEIEQDMEVTLVHELLHLHTAPLAHVLKAESLEERYEEQMIDAVSRALVAQRRRAEAA